MKQEQLEELLALGHETPSVECKGPGPRSDGYLLAEVARAVMGMTNRRDGGIIIIGVAERSGVFNIVGLSPDQVDSWRNNDHVIDALAKYMNPPAKFDLSIQKLQEKDLVILSVHEFEDTPTICKKEYLHNHRSGPPETILRNGACYVRSRHKPETLEVSSPEHMRDLLNLAIEKGVRKFVTQAQKAGMNISINQLLSDQDLFQQQTQDWTNPFIAKLRSRGYWQTIIRPDMFIRDRLPYVRLYPLLENVSVEFRGWDFPHIYEPPVNGLERGADWIAQGKEWNYFLEAWRFYQSGQFIHIAGMNEDWSEEARGLHLPEESKPSDLLFIEDVVSRFTLIFEFASRLALSPEYAAHDRIHVEVLVHGLQGRRLHIRDGSIVPFRFKYETSLQEFLYAQDFQLDELISRRRELALDCSTELFRRFGWEPPKASLQGRQSQLTDAQ